MQVSVRDITEFKKAEEELQQGFGRLRKALSGTVQAFAMVVEARDPYTAGHQKRVANLAHAIAAEMGIEANRIDGLRMASMIHDIGKISVPADILSKPTKLTSTEFSLIKVHSQTGYDILKEIEFPWPVAQMVFQHHEKMDGSGYPNGLKEMIFSYVHGSWPWLTWWRLWHLTVPIVLPWKLMQRWMKSRRTEESFTTTPLQMPV